MERIKNKIKPVYRYKLGEPRSIKDIKRVSKKYHCTINDLVILAVSETFKDYFKIASPSVEEHDLRICIPANIRMSHYENEKDIRLENKFTVVPMKISLVDKTNEFSNNLLKI